MGVYKPSAVADSYIFVKHPVDSICMRFQGLNATLVTECKDSRCLANGGKFDKSCVLCLMSHPKRRQQT